MSMIHGIISLSGQPVDEKDIKTMLDTTRSFCPDGNNFLLIGDVALGAGLLKTLPENRHEPHPVVTDADTGLTIVADVRIDNREELLNCLGIKLAEVEALSDVKLILEAFKKWGTLCAERIIGDFAFVIWDKSTRTFFCCRDVFAIRPFYYYAGKDWFVFSSDLAALEALPWIPKVIDDYYIADRIGGLHLYDNKTPYFDIHCLDAAHYKLIRNRKILHCQRYWKPDLNREIFYAKEESYVEKYMELLTEAVRCRLVSDAPVASFISGGLDSSSISVIAARKMCEKGQEIFAFCHVLPEVESTPDKDERHLVALLEKKAGLSVFWITRDLFKENVTSVFEEGNPFIVTSQAIAQQKGCRVFLDGFGGDQVATWRGNCVMNWLIRNRDVAGVFRQAKALSKIHGTPLLKSMIGALIRHHPFQSQTVSQKDMYEFLYHRCCFNHDFADAIHVMKFAGSAYRFCKGNPSSVRNVMWKKLTTGVYPLNSLARSFGHQLLEPRYPMFDRRLVEYCISLPMEQHRLGEGRRLIRRAMKGLLPNEIRMRSDKRFSANPGLQAYISMQLDDYFEILGKTIDNPGVSTYIDLEKVRKRLEALPQLILEKRENKFAMGATLRALRLAHAMITEYQFS